MELVNSTNKNHVLDSVDRINNYLKSRRHYIENNNQTRKKDKMYL